jgi:hypothetical protein
MALARYVELKQKRSVQQGFRVQLGTTPAYAIIYSKQTHPVTSISRYAPALHLCAERQVDLCV